MNVLKSRNSLRTLGWNYLQFFRKRVVRLKTQSWNRARNVTTTYITYVYCVYDCISDTNFHEFIQIYMDVREIYKYFREYIHWYIVELHLISFDFQFKFNQITPKMSKDSYLTSQRGSQDIPTISTVFRQ